jgi:gamma-glutamylcyclotransferase (GGCT)/AIG2-like uncharacterized protein YtfP
MNLHNLFLEAGEQPIYYFAYGMLTDPEIMDGIELVGVAKLPNFRYEMFEYANVVPEPSSVVYGCLWKVDRRIIANLDRVEGYPTLYDRKTVPVYVKGQKYAAELYTMTPATREQLADTGPSDSYIEKIERGYSHAGVPLAQVDAALDELYARHQVDEAAMNPTTFAAAIGTGQEQGVLVGFEFEVCIPLKSIATMTQAEDPAEIQPRTTKDIANIIDEYDVFEHVDTTSLPPEKFDQIFKLKPNAQDVAFPSMVETQRHVREQKLNEIKELFKQITPKKREHAIKWLKYNYSQVFADEIKFAKAFGHQVYILNRGRDEDLGRYIKNLAASVDDYSVLLRYMLRTGGYDTMEKFPEVFDFDPQAVYKLLNLEGYENDEDDYYDDDDENYMDGAKLLKPYVQQAMGSQVIIYKEYHQDTKNLTDWYIEPDGSLEPNNNDTSAEVVSPPLPANQAMDALKKFYAIAKQLKLYTSANNSTGLHINVSIPKDIDLLKLAMFLGDQHVLQMFGRQNNKYVDSVLRRMQRHETKLNNNQLDIQLLQRIAQDSTRSHRASISQGGNYLSFRHAGGDYLNRYEDIVNVVGRFVRAMVIASDPNAYRNEYLKKLTAFVGSNQPQIQSSATANLKQVYNVLRQQGLPIYTFNVMITSKSVKKVETIIDYINNNVNYRIGRKLASVVPQSTVAQQDIVGQFKKPDLKALAQQALPQAFITIVSPPEDNSASSIRSRAFSNPSAGVATIYDYNDRRVGYFTTTKTFLPPTDPETQKAVKVIAQQYMAALKREQTAARRRATRQRNQAAKANS